MNRKTRNEKRRIKFTQEFLDDMRKTEIPFLQKSLSKKAGVEVTFVEFIKRDGICFAMFKTPLPPPRDSVRILVQQNSSSNIPQPLNRKPRRQGSGEQFLREMQELSLVNSKYTLEFWDAFREEAVPYCVDPSVSGFPVQLFFHAITNENGIPVMHLQLGKTDYMCRWKIFEPNASNNFRVQIIPHEVFTIQFGLKTAL